MSKKGQSNSQLKTDRLKGDWKALEIVHPHAAGIDIGGSEHWVAINPERDERELQAVVGDSRIAFTNQPWLASRLGAIAAAIIGILGLLMASRSGNVLRLVLSETMRPVALSRQPIADLGGSRRQQPSRLLSTTHRLDEDSAADPTKSG